MSGLVIGPEDKEITLEDALEAIMGDALAEANVPVVVSKIEVG